MSTRLFQAVLLGAIAATIGCNDEDSLPSVPEFRALHDLADAPEPIRKAADAVVRIETDLQFGTGMFIGASGELLTNNHVLGAGTCAREGCFATLALHHERGTTRDQSIRVFVKPTRIHPELDLAYVQVFQIEKELPTTPLVTPNFLSFSRRSAESLIGERVYVVGHPQGRLKKWSDGEVTEVSGRWFSTTAFALPGSSGSPYLDQEGHVVGILHRGAFELSRLTPNGANDESIGSASEDVMNALESPVAGADGLAFLRAVDAPTTAEVVVHDYASWLGAHRAEVTIGETKRRVVDVLAEACDAALAIPRYPTVDEFEEAMTACVAAPNWIACRNADAWQTCPAGDDANVWRARFKRIGDAFSPIDTATWLFYRTRVLGSLEARDDAAYAAAKTELDVLLAANPLPLDLPLASALAYAGFADYKGVDLAEYVRSYDKIAHYELEVSSLVGAMLWLNRHGRFDGPRIDGTLIALLGDPRVALGSHLYVEEVAFRNGAIE